MTSSALSATIKKIKDYVDLHNLLPPGSKVVVGFSGGPDSVFLLHLLLQKNLWPELTVVAAHLDHEWRPESSQEAQFCAAVTKKLGVLFVSRTITELAPPFKFKGSQEDYGRKARRYFLEQVKKETSADLIALAHHAQDQQETFFIRLIRGSSLSGLTGMKPKQGCYVRPLLNLDKDTILAYLKQHDIAYITDPSNESPDFLRNRIRATVLPALRACDQRFDKNFFATLARLQETDAFLDQLAQQKLTSLCCQHETHTALAIPAFLELDPVLQYRVLLHFLCQEGALFTPTQAFLDEIIRFFRQPEGKTHQLHTDWALVKRKKLAWISQKDKQ